MENENTERTGELTPEDINNMSPDEFSKYLDEIDAREEPFYSAERSEGTLRSEDTPPEPEEPEDDTGTGTDTNSSPSERSPEEASETPPEQQPETEENAQEAAPAQPFRSYATKDEYDRDIQQRINEAVQQDRQNRSTDDETVRRISDIAGYYYRDAENPMQAMADYIEKTAAEQDGVDIAEYRDRMDTQRKAKAYDDMQRRNQERQTARKQIYDTWMRDAQQLKIIDPDFDFNTAMQNPAFKNDIISGKSVAEAYKNISTPPQAAAPKRAPITQNAQTAQRGTGEASSNPASLPTRDFMEYINRIKES